LLGDKIVYALKTAWICGFFVYTDIKLAPSRNLDHLEFLHMCMFFLVRDQKFRIPANLQIDFDGLFGKIMQTRRIETRAL